MAPKGYSGRLRAEYDGTAANRLVSIVDVDGPANGAPNPGFTPRVSWRSVTLTMREHPCQPITVNFDNSMPRSPSVPNQHCNTHFAADVVRDFSNIPNDTVQPRSATQTPVGERGVDQILLVRRITRGEVSIVFLHARTLGDAGDQLLAFGSTHQVGSQILRAGSPRSNKRHPRAVRSPFFGCVTASPLVPQGLSRLSPRRMRIL